MRTNAALLVLAAALAAGCAAPGTHDVLGVPAQGQTVVTYVLHVEGMTCPYRCAREVREMLAKVGGVFEVTTDVPSQTVTCVVAEGVDPQALVAAIRTPYSARLL